IAKDDVSAGTCTHNGVARTQADFETASRAPAETLPHDGLDVCAAEVEDVDARTEVSSASEPAEIDNAGIDAEKENAEIGDTEVDNTEVHNTEISNTLEPLAARRADGLRLLAETFLSAPPGARVDTTADRYQVVVH